MLLVDGRRAPQPGDMGPESRRGLRAERAARNCRIEIFVAIHIEFAWLSSHREHLPGILRVTLSFLKRINYFAQLSA